MAPKTGFSFIRFALFAYVRLVICDCWLFLCWYLVAVRFGLPVLAKWLAGKTGYLHQSRKVKC